MASPDVGVPAWEGILAGLGALGTAFALIINAIKGKRAEEEKPPPAKQLVLEHATTEEIQPWVDHVEKIEDHLGAIRQMMRTWLDEEAKRLMRAQVRIELQEEESRKRFEERLADTDRRRRQDS